MSRTPRLLASAVMVLSVLVPVAGCGNSKDSKIATDTRKPPRSAEVPPPRLPRPDSRAYAAIQKASGDLRAAVTSVAYGTGARIPVDQLHADIGKLEALEPRSPLLGRLRRQAVNAMQSASATSATPKAIARAAIAEADRIDAGLRRYAASNPAANEIAPG